MPWVVEESFDAEKKLLKFEEKAEKICTVFHLFPLRKASPPVTSVSPVSILKVDDFPAPFTPRSPKHWGYKWAQCIWEQDPATSFSALTRWEEANLTLRTARGTQVHFQKKINNLLGFYFWYKLLGWEDEQTLVCSVVPPWYTVTTVHLCQTLHTGVWLLVPDT